MLPKKRKSAAAAAASTLDALQSVAGNSSLNVRSCIYCPIVCLFVSSISMIHLQLFQRRLLQLSIASEKIIILEPMAIYSTQMPVQFRIAALDEFLSPEVFILCEVSIVNGDGSAIAGGEPPTDPVAPTVNFVHSMWQDVDVVINGTLISGRT